MRDFGAPDYDWSGATKRVELAPDAPYTGIRRTAWETASSYITNLESKQREFRIIRDMVDDSVAILTPSKSLIDFGKLLDEACHAKRGLDLSNHEVNRVYATARSAGRGGFFLLFDAETDYSMEEKQ